jgi:hypothetical protein
MHSFILAGAKLSAGENRAENQYVYAAVRPAATSAGVDRCLVRHGLKRHHLEMWEHIIRKELPSFHGKNAWFEWGSSKRRVCLCEAVNIPSQPEHFLNALLSRIFNERFPIESRRELA